nr:hypothetical protein [Novosphingobium panipatense]
MSIDNLYLLLFAVIFGVSLAGTAILADGSFGRGARRTMAALGCCVILASVVAL